MENTFFNDEYELYNNCLKKNDFEEDIIPKFYNINEDNFKSLISSKSFSKYKNFLTENENDMDLENIPESKINIGIEKEKENRNFYFNMNMDLDEENNENNNKENFICKKNKINRNKKCLYFSQKAKKLIEKNSNFGKYKNNILYLFKDKFLNKKRDVFTEIINNYQIQN